MKLLSVDHIHFFATELDEAVKFMRTSVSGL